MKLNLSKLSSTASTTSETKKVTFLNNLENSEKTSTNSTSALNLDFSIISEKTKTPEPIEKGFNLTFTEGKTYNLDDIIYLKRRDNADCPLIVKVDLDNKNDSEVIKTITQMILTDYDVSYTEDTYKEDISKVPNFSEVFTVYFNKYYLYYYNNQTSVKEGSISLSSIKEQLYNIHDGDYSNLYGDMSQPYSSYADNKPTVDYEYGTGPEDKADEYDFDIPTTLAVNKNTLNLYNGFSPIATQTPIYFKTINGESLFGQGNITVSTSSGEGGTGTSDSNFELTDTTLELTDYVEICSPTDPFSSESVDIDLQDNV